MAQDWFTLNAPGAKKDTGTDWFAANAPKSAPAAAPPPEAKGVGDHVGDALSSFWNVVNPIEGIKGMADMIRSPLQTGRAMLDAQGQLATDAKQSFDAGNYGEAARQGLNYLIPVLGPAINAAQEQGQQGDYGGMVGTSIGLGASLAAPPVVGRGNARIGAVAPQRNPMMADAVAFAEREGIPVDAATASGNRFVSAAQNVTDRTLGGSVIGERAQRAQADALTATGTRLAERASPNAITRERAGASVAGRFQDAVRDQHSIATEAYGTLRELEADPKNATVFDRGTRDVASSILGPDGKPVVRTEAVRDVVPLAVDISAAKQQLKPLYESLLRKRELTGVLQGGEGRTLTALDALMRAPDAAPLSLVDSALGDIKAMARGADMPELRTGGQASAAQIVAQLDKSVLEAASKAPPEVMAALQEGRRATVNKYVAADVLEALGKQTPDEPVRVFNRLTGRQDTTIGLLRDVARLAPDELPQIGRAYLDDLLATATAEGGFGKAKGLQAKWQSLGDETKRLLFKDDAHRADLDKFFLLAKKMEDNPNPSGTAHTLLTAGQGGLILTEPVTGFATQIGLAGLSKFLHSPRGVRLLTQGLNLPRANKAAATALTAQLLTLGGRDWSPTE